MKKRFDSLQALKAAACLLVFFNHTGLKIIGTGAIAVFYICSGFTLVYSYQDRVDSLPRGFIGSLRFAVKKVAKLYPLYIICMLPVLALDLMYMMENFSGGALFLFAKKLIASLLLIQSWSWNSDIALAFNGVAWFLSTAMFLYFCAPFVIRLVTRACVRKRALLLIIVTVALQFAVGFAMEPLEAFLISCGVGIEPGRFSYWFTYIFPPFRVLDLIIGSLLAVFYLDNNGRKASAAVSAAMDIGLVLMWLGAALIYWKTRIFLTGEAFKYTQLFTVPALAAVYIFAMEQGMVVKLLTNRFTLFVGRISSDFFLLHQNIIRFTIMFLSMAAVPYEMLKILIPLLCFALTVAACLLWEKLNAALRSRKRVKSPL